MADLKLLRKVLVAHQSFWARVKKVDEKFDTFATQLGDVLGKSAAAKAVSLSKAIEAKNVENAAKCRDDLNAKLVKKMASVEAKIEKEEAKAAKALAAAKAKAAKAKAAKAEKAKAEKAKAAKAKKSASSKPKKARKPRAASVKKSATPAAYSLFGGEHFEYEFDQAAM